MTPRLKDKEERLEELRKMIYELANGNFSHRIKLTNIHDDIESFSLMLNMLAEELGSFFIHPASFHKKNILKPYTLLLDADFKIIDANPIFLKLLNLPSKKILLKPIQQFLTPFTHKKLLEALNTSLNKEKAAPINILLRFLPFNMSPLNCWGYCHRLTALNKTLYFIRGLPIGYHNPHNKLVVSKKASLFPHDNSLQYQADTQKIRAIHQYILKHLHKPLPPISTLSKQFHINEHKLKKGFKQLYQTTIFKFHLEKRLEQAMLMVKYTSLPFKAITRLLGFKYPTHFSQAFKAKYIYSPRHYRKKFSTP